MGSATCEAMVCAAPCGRPATVRWTRRVPEDGAKDVYVFCAGCARPTAHEEFDIEALTAGGA